MSDRVFWTEERTRRFHELVEETGDRRVIAAELGCSVRKVEHKAQRTGVQLAGGERQPAGGHRLGAQVAKIKAARFRAKRPSNAHRDSIAATHRPGTPEGYDSNRRPGQVLFAIGGADGAAGLQNFLAAFVGTGRAGLLELKEDQCRWPLEADGETRFCGAPKDKGAYCTRHARIASSGVTQAAALRRDGSDLRRLMDLARARRGAV